MFESSFKVGDIISERYKLVQEIGRGGFGVVFKAIQLGMERDVAIKILHINSSLDGTARERFRREALVVRNLNHPNTIRQYDFGETENGTLFLVLEFLQGLNLVQMIRRDGALGDERTKSFAVGVLKSLSEAHSQGIVHRDLKPGNIMLCDVYGEKDYPKVLDFGIAKVMMGDSPDLTAAGIALGSPRYMAPEILRGEDPTPAADVYSIAISLAEAIIGQPLFKSEGSLDAAKIQLDPGPLPIPDVLKVSSLWPWLSLGLKKDLNLRYKSAEEMLRFLDADLEELSARGADLIPSIAPTNIMPAIDSDTDIFSEPHRLTMLGSPTSAVADDDTNILTAEDAQKAIDEIRRSEIEKNTTQEQAIAVPVLDPVLDGLHAAQAASNIARATIESPPPHLTPEQVVVEGRPTTVYEAVAQNPPPVFSQQSQTDFNAGPTDLHKNKGFVQPPKSSIFEQPPAQPQNPQKQSNMGPMTLHEPPPPEEPKEKSSPTKIIVTMVALFVGAIVLLIIAVAIFLMFFKPKEGTAPNVDPIPKVQPDKKDEIGDVEKKKIEPKIMKKLTTFDLTSSPVGATVFVNGKKRGKTPLTFSLENTKLPIEILLRKKGYEPYAASLDGKSTKIEAALLPVFGKK